MEIIIFNKKGGVGKSMLATQISLYFDTSIIELDPYGVLTQTLDEDRVLKLGLNNEIPKINGGDIIYDFGGFDDNRLEVASKTSDMIIIPFNPTINALGTTLQSYKRAKEQNLPILFVANAVIKEQDAIDAIEFIKEHTQDDIDYFTIPHTRALQTSENEGVSIIDLANSSGLKRHTYRKINATMNNLMATIKEYK
jgi:chromosome partitioning protein